MKKQLDKRRIPADTAPVTPIQRLTPALLAVTVALLPLTGCSTAVDSAVSGSDYGSYNPDAPVPAPVTSGVPKTANADTRKTTAADWEGLQIETAEDQARRWQVPFRIVEENGNKHLLTEEYIPVRVNAVIENGMVIEVWYG